MSPPRLRAAETTLLVIDVQEKLLPAIPRAAELLLNLSFLVDAANLLDVPVLATEQYPRGLGPTAAPIAERLREPRPSKVEFSCGGVVEVAAALRERPTILLAGMESHVCVLQTALDLVERGATVALAVDAVAGRFALDHDLALRRMERAGVLLATVETVVFEWLGSSATPRFKAVSALVQERARRLRDLVPNGTLP